MADWEDFFICDVIAPMDLIEVLAAVGVLPVTARTGSLEEWFGYEKEFGRFAPEWAGDEWADYFSGVYPSETTTLAEWYDIAKQEAGLFYPEVPE